MDVWNGGRIGPMLAVVALLATSSGCTIAPKRFSDLIAPAPLMRARAASMGDNLAPQVVVPALIDRLSDEDPVVRLTAHEQLKQRTRQDFGYEPWADPDARAEAINRWKSWWNGVVAASRQPATRPAIATPPPSTVTAQPARRATSRPRVSSAGSMTHVRQSMPQMPTNGG